MNVSFADGQMHPQRVEIVTAPVTLQGRTVNTTFTVLPQNRKQRPFWEYFLEDMGITIYFQLRTGHGNHPYESKD